MPDKSALNAGFLTNNAGFAITKKPARGRSKKSGSGQARTVLEG
jgi:hypothetical protein